MLGVEGVGPSTTTTTFSTATTIPMGTTAAAAVVPGSGVGLVPLVAVATGDPDPRPLLLPVPALNASTSKSVGSTASNTTTSNVNNKLNNNNNISSNPAAMEQAEDIIKPIMKDGQVYLEVECGQNKAAMYLNKLCQGSKGPCINFKGSWLTPNEFQFVSGRETAKDWKRSIRHHGKSLKLLLSKGILSVHPTMCDCEGCRIGAVLTRKGEKRRIPNGERKRKSTGSTPENSGTGAFRAVSNNGGALKNEDGPSDPKRLLLDKPAEGGQSPLKESSVMNLPDSSKDGSSVRLPDGHMADVSKMVVDGRLAPNPLAPLLSAERGGTVLSSDALGDHRDLSAPSKPKLQRSNSQSSIPLSETDSVMSSADVKVLSSSGNTGASALDKSMSRLALYQAASASIRYMDYNGQVESPSSAPAVEARNTLKDENQQSGNTTENDSSSSQSSVGKDSHDALVQNESNSEPEKESEPENKTESENKAEPEKTALEKSETEAVGVGSEDKDSKPSVSSSLTEQTKCEPNNNSSTTSIGINVSSPSPPAPSVAAATSPVMTPVPTMAAPHTVLTQTDSSYKDLTVEDRQGQSAATPAAESSSSVGHELLGKERHVTIRHPSPERRPEESTSVSKHSQVKPSKEHHTEKCKDRKPDSSSSTTSPTDHKTTRVSKDKDSPSSRHSHERDAEKRRTDQRTDRDRKSSFTSGQSSKLEDPSPRAPDFAGVGSGRPEGIPATAPVPPVPVPAQVADPAAFSEYMRVLAAGHNNLVPPPTGLPPVSMYPLRQPTDVALSSGLMHPMHAAACGIFATPSNLLSKEHVMYPATTGALSNVSYGYGAPGMTPMPLLPHQYSSAASSSVLDYPRPFPYLPWPSSLPLMMPDAMAAAAAAAAASSSAKRSREEMESGVDMTGKRLQLPMPPYGVGSVGPMDYMSAYRGLMTPMPCGLESSMFDKNAEYFRKRMYPDPAGSVVGSSKGVESSYLASLPEYYKALYSCRCMENRPGDVRTWSVEEVAKMVSSVEGCSIYTETFREQRVDGRILVLLTADCLIKNLGMKLGPAMSLISRVAKLLLESTSSSGCDSCRRLASMAPAVQSAVGYS